MRAAADELRDAGIQNADQVARLGAAALIERCLACWRAKPMAGTAVLAQMVVQGGPSDIDGRRLSERQRIIGEMNAWQRGYDDGEAGP